MQNIIKRNTIAQLFQIKAAKLNDQLLFTVAWITKDLLLRNSLLNDTNTVVVRDLVSHPRGRHMATVLTVMDAVYRVLTGDKQSPARSILSEGMIDELESRGIDTTDTKLELIYEPSGLFVEMIDARLHSNELKSDWKETRNLIFSKIVMSPDGPLPFSNAWFKLRDEYNKDMVQMHLVDKPFIWVNEASQMTVEARDQLITALVDGVLLLELGIKWKPMVIKLVNRNEGRH